MDSGRTRGKIFIAIGITLIIIIIVVTALKNKTEKPADGNPTLFEGIKNLAQNTTETVSDFIDDGVRKIIPIEIKDLNNNSDGIPNVLKLSEEETVAVAIPEESYGAGSPDLPQLRPFPRIVKAQDGTVDRISIEKSKPVQTLLAKGGTTELFDATIGNNLTTIIAKSRTLTTLSHYLGIMEKNTKNYCPYTLVINKKNIYNQQELEQIYGILEVNKIIASTFPPFTDYKTNAQDLIKAYQIQNNLSKKPTGILDTKTLEMLLNTCSENTKIEMRSKGEQIPDYLLTYSPLNSAVEDMIPSKDTIQGALLLNTASGVSIGSLTDISKPATYKSNFSSPFTDFNIEFPNNNSLVATTRPATGYEGVSYKLDIKTNKRITLVENVKGLMTLMSPDEKYTLFSSNDFDDQLLILLNNTTYEQTALPFVTIPDKCAWTNDSLHIICGVPVDGAVAAEDWLKGSPVNDELKSYNIERNTVSDLPQPQEEVDVFKGRVSSEDSYFGFINRKNMQPWMISLVDFIK